MRFPARQPTRIASSAFGSDIDPTRRPAVTSTSRLTPRFDQSSVRSSPESVRSRSGTGVTPQDPSVLIELPSPALPESGSTGRGSLPAPSQPPAGGSPVLVGASVVVALRARPTLGGDGPPATRLRRYRGQCARVCHGRAPIRCRFVPRLRAPGSARGSARRLARAVARRRRTASRSRSRAPGRRARPSRPRR